MQDEEHKSLKYLLALAYLPPSDVIIAFETLQEICPVSIESKIDVCSLSFNNQFFDRHLWSIRRSLYRSFTSQRTSISAIIQHWAMELDGCFNFLRKSAADEHDDQTMGWNISSVPRSIFPDEFKLFDHHFRHPCFLVLIERWRKFFVQFNNCTNIKCIRNSEINRQFAQIGFFNGITSTNFKRSSNRIDQSVLKIISSSWSNIYRFNCLIGQQRC